MTEDAPQKKIELNFKSMPSDRVKEMAVATCGVETVVMRGAGQVIMSAIMHLEKGQMEMTSMTQAGVMYLDQIHQAMHDLDREMSKLENVAKPSIFNRILGKGVATQGTVDALEKMIDFCDKAVGDLRNHAEHMRKDIDKKVDFCDQVIAEASQLKTQESMNLRNKVYRLRDSFGESCRAATDLIKASDSLAQGGTMMRDRADQLVTKHKAYLAGAKAGP